MKRGYLYRIPALAVGFLLFQIATSSADDRIEYRDAKNRASILIATGSIVEENFTTIKLKLAGGGKEAIIPVADVVKMLPDLPGAAKLEFGPVSAAEDRQEFQKALDGYKGLTSKVAGNDRAKRHVEYKIALLSFTLALENPTAVQAAIDALKKFVGSSPVNWQTINAAKLLIALQLRSNDSSGALATADAWVKFTGLPKELKQEAELARVEVLFQTGKIKEAKARAEELAKDLPPTDAVRLKLELYVLAGSVQDPTTKIADVAKKFQDLIDKSSDTSYKAAAYNLLGNCYAIKGQPRDAMWSYLWVDVVYNQDRNEHAKALDQLARLFDSEAMKDTERAKLFKDKLVRLRQ